MEFIQNVDKSNAINMSKCVKPYKRGSLWPANLHWWPIADGFNIECCTKDNGTLVS